MLEERDRGGEMRIGGDFSGELVTSDVFTIYVFRRHQ